MIKNLFKLLGGYIKARFAVAGFKARYGMWAKMSNSKSTFWRAYFLSKLIDGQKK